MGYIEKEIEGYKEILTSPERQKLGVLSNKSNKDPRSLSLDEERELEELILKRQKEEDLNREVIGEYREKAIEDLGDLLGKEMKKMNR